MTALDWTHAAREIPADGLAVNRSATADEALRLDLVAFARRRLGGLAPKEILFDEHLPHNSSGKVMRRVLKARALGLPEGDVSTMERQP